MPSFRYEDLHIEGSSYIGRILSANIYGIYLGVYCLSIFALAMNTKTSRLHRNFYMVFSSILLLLNTFAFMPLPYVGHMTWIVKRNTYPGGPLEYFDLESNKTPVSILGNMAQTLAAALNDGLLESFLVSWPIEISYFLSPLPSEQVYRCYVIFGSRLYIVIFPVLCNLTSLALGIAIIPMSLNPNLESQNLERLNAVAVALNTTINVMITTMISIKILFVSRILSSIDSLPDHVRTYTNVVAILLESAAPCAVLGILACIGWFMDPCSSAFCLDAEVFTLGWIMSIMLFPQLIIYRVANGSAWTEKTSQELTQLTGSLAFAPREMNTTMSDSEPNMLAVGIYLQTDEGKTVQATSV